MGEEDEKYISQNISITNFYYLPRAYPRHCMGAYFGYIFCISGNLFAYTH